MKKLIVICAAVMVSTAAFSQTEKKTETQTTTTTTTATPEMKMAHECYMMKDNTLMHCMGTKTEPQKTDVTLQNGTMISTKGEVTTKEGTKSMLANGQCMEMTGKTGDCEKMHSGMKMMKEEKMEAKPADAK